MDPKVIRVALARQGAATVRVRLAQTAPGGDVYIDHVFTKVPRAEVEAWLAETDAAAEARVERRHAQVMSVARRTLVAAWWQWRSAWWRPLPPSWRLGRSFRDGSGEALMPRAKHRRKGKTRPRAPARGRAGLGGALSAEPDPAWVTPCLSSAGQAMADRDAF
jgi:hypothetical protein